MFCKKKHCNWKEHLVNRQKYIEPSWRAQKWTMKSHPRPNKPGFSPRNYTQSCAARSQPTFIPQARASEEEIRGSSPPRRMQQPKTPPAAAASGLNYQWMKLELCSALYNASPDFLEDFSALPVMSFFFLVTRENAIKTYTVLGEVSASRQSGFSRLLVLRTNNEVNLYVGETRGCLRWWDLLLNGVTGFCKIL